MSKVKIIIAIDIMLIVGAVCFGIGRATATNKAEINGAAYQVYIYDDGTATITVDNANLINEGNKGLFVSNGR